MIKAAKGGQVSRVNGCDYVGGQFMPEHGEYCGQGKNRITKTKLAEVNAKLTGSRIIYNDKLNIFQLVKIVTFRDGFKAEQVQFVAASIKTLEKLVS